MWNTPPTFAIYVLGKVAHWLAEDIGGLAGDGETESREIAMLYDVIDSHQRLLQRPRASRIARSLMNVTFTLPNDDLQANFIAEAAEHDLASLKGHRSVGGIRASIYNAMPREGRRVARQFMKDFAAKNG